MGKYTIYKHTLPNNKVYIGCTSRNAEERWKNGFGYYNNKIFYNDIVLFGWKNIRHEILATGLERKEAFELEQDLIVQHKSYMPEFGYNISRGFGRTGYRVEYSDETRALISKS